MKLFYFEYNSYGPEYTVMSVNEDRAKKAVLNYLFERTEKYKADFPSSLYYNSLLEDYNMWKSAIDNNKLPDGYKIVFYEADKIIETEVS